MNKLKVFYAATIGRSRYNFSELGQRGSVGVIAAVGGLMLLCMGGVGIDLERVWLVLCRLQTLLDAAGLAAALTYA
ncbi:MAG: pilus assembly protein TadG-related protein [Janthinobacterium lividum]